MLTENGVYDSFHSKIRELKTEDLLLLKELIERDKLKPIVDRVYPMEDIVDAHSYVDKGHKKGNVVIQVAASM